MKELDWYERTMYNFAMSTLKKKNIKPKKIPKFFRDVMGSFKE